MSTLAILVLSALAFLKGLDTSTAIASIAIGLAGSNAFEGAKAPAAAVTSAVQAEKPVPPEGG